MYGLQGKPGRKFVLDRENSVWVAFGVYGVTYWRSGEICRASNVREHIPEVLFLKFSRKCMIGGLSSARSTFVPWSHLCVALFGSCIVKSKPRSYSYHGFTSPHQFCPWVTHSGPNESVLTTSSACLPCGATCGSSYFGLSCPKAEARKDPWYLGIRHPYEFD